MGGGRTPHAALTRRRFGIAAAMAAAAVIGACGSDETPTRSVGPADAYMAIVAWQASQQKPVLDDDGEPKLPVIYVVDADGDTVDVGVQAAVAEAMTDDAVVRFADNANEGFDLDAEGAPVRDQGVLLAIGIMPEPARTIEVNVERFVAEDISESLSVQVSVTPTQTVGTDPSPPPAEVTSVSPR